MSKMICIGIIMSIVSPVCLAISSPVTDCSSRGLADDWPAGCTVVSADCTVELDCDRVDGPIIDISQGLLSETIDAIGGRMTGDNNIGCPRCCPKTNLTVGGTLTYSYAEGCSSSVGAEAGLLAAKVSAEVGHNLGRTLTVSGFCSQDVLPCYSGGVEFLGKAQENIKKEMTTTFTYTSREVCGDTQTTICGPDSFQQTETLTYDLCLGASCQNMVQVAGH